MRFAPDLKKLAGRLLVAGAVVVLLRSAFSKAPDPPEKSPHEDALELVLKTQGDVVRKAEDAWGPIRKPDEARSWWHDIEVRTWRVWRSSPTGFRDTSHSFEVGYFIAGDEVALWGVNTQVRKVASFDPLSKERDERFGDWNQSGLRRDLDLMRTQRRIDDIESKFITADNARQSASRVFDRIKFKGMSRADVLWILGPLYAIVPSGPQNEGPEDPMVYQFIGMESGDEYRLEMKDNRVVEVQRKTIPGIRKP